MPNGLEPLPFDEKNRQDFLQVTERINAALEKMGEDKSIPATQVTLSQLAGCARKTLHNRKWPIIKLKEVKTARKAQKASVRPATTVYDRMKVEPPPNREKELTAQIQNYQDQNGQLFGQVQELKEQVLALQELNKVLEHEVSTLKETRRELQSELRQLREDPRSNKLLEFPPSNRAPFIREE